MNDIPDIVYNEQFIHVKCILGSKIVFVVFLNENCLYTSKNKYDYESSKSRTRSNKSMQSQMQNMPFFLQRIPQKRTGNKKR